VEPNERKLGSGGCALEGDSGSLTPSCLSLFASQLPWGELLLPHCACLPWYAALPQAQKPWIGKRIYWGWREGESKDLLGCHLKGKRLGGELGKGHSATAEPTVTMGLGTGFYRLSMGFRRLAVASLDHGLNSHLALPSSFHLDILFLWCLQKQEGVRGCLFCTPSMPNNEIRVVQRKEIYHLI
jgi:hypothetical protein